MRKQAWFVFALVAFLALASVVAGGRPQLGTFTTTGYTTFLGGEFLPSGDIKFYLEAQGGLEPEVTTRVPSLQ